MRTVDTNYLLQRQPERCTFNTRTADTKTAAHKDVHLTDTSSAMAETIPFEQVYIDDGL